MNRKTAADRVLALFLTGAFILAVSVSSSDFKSVPADSDLSNRSFGVNGLVGSNWSFDRAKEWGDFAYVHGNSAELVIGVSDAQLDAYDELARIAAIHSGRIVNTVSIREEILAVIADIPFDLISSFANKIETAGLARYIEPNMRFQTQFVPNDPYWSWQWGPQKIEANLAWDTTTGNPSVLVAVIDTGIDWNHPDLAANYVALGYDWVNMDSDPMDDHGHGTHCAGIVAAELNNAIGIAGMAQVKIMAEKGLDSSGGGYEDDLANALIHAVDQGADILSNSWGSYGESALIYDAVKYAYDAGVLIVAAAGNDATSNKLYPAAYDEAIAVTATDQLDNPASFTNFGDWVEVAAPGVNIYSTLWDNTYGYKSGTSMATPHVSGVAALIWSQFPGANRDWVRAQLRYTSDDLGELGFDNYYGYGRVNARKAVEQAPPDHDLLIFDWERPQYIKVGDQATFNTTVLNFGTSYETNVGVQLLVNSSLLDSASIAFMPWGTSATVGLSWTPTVAGKYNVTSYVVPVPGETITQNNLITEIVSVVAPPPETNWILLSTDPDEGFGTNLQMVYGQLYSGVIFFKVMHYRPWITIGDINTAIFIDSDQNPATGLPDGTYPGQNTGIGADYIIIVGSEATEMWRWDPILGLWDTANPISLAYLDAPNNADVFVVGVYLTDVQSPEALDGAVADIPSNWDWMPDTGHFFTLLFIDNLSVSLEAPTVLDPGDSTLLNATVYNVGLSSETNVELQLLTNGTLVDSTVIPELVSGSSYTLSYPWTPTIEGIYNVTAYAPPVPLEELVSNNVASKSVQVIVLPNILIVSDDDAPYLINGTSLSEFESALTTVGLDYVVWNESTMGRPSLEFLLKFKLVIWTCGDYFGGAVDSTDATTLEAYFSQGGNILLEGEDIGYDHGPDSFMVNVAHAVFQVDDTGALGLIVTDPTHPVTQGLPPSFTWLTDPPFDDGVTPTNQGAEVIRYTDTTWTAVTVYNGGGTTNGSVVYYAFLIYSLGQPERDTLIINSVNWLLEPVHDVAITNVMPSKTVVGQSYSTSINVTVENQGDYTETFDVTVSAGTTGITNGLAGYWKFDEGSGTTAYDSSGNGNHGNLVNGPAWVDGKYGKALSFDGVDDSVHVPDSNSLDIAEEITISAWIKTVPGTDIMEIVDKGDSNNPAYMGYALRISKDNDPVPPSAGPNERGRANFAIFLTGLPFPINAPHINSWTRVDDNNWHFIAATYDGTAMRMYVDGVLETAFDVSGTLYTNDYFLSLGQGRGGGRSFNGIMDEARIYNRTLNAEEIRDLAVFSQTQTVANLLPHSSTTITFTWNTAGFAYGNYTISAYATPVSSETDTADNTYTDGTILVTIAGDVNGDQLVNVSDLHALSKAYGLSPSSLNWNPNADINNDLIVNALDLETLNKNYGKIWT